MNDRNAPNPASEKEKAEGSRETVGADNQPSGGGAGITNRPLEEEQESQKRVPERGRRRDEDEREEERP